MASLYAGLDLTFTNAVDGIDVDRLSTPTSPTHPSRKRNGSVNTVCSQDGGGGGGGGGGDAGLGTLADELAALDFDNDDEGDDDYGDDEEEGEGEGEEQQEEDEQEQREGSGSGSGSGSGTETGTETETEAKGGYTKNEENQKQVGGPTQTDQEEEEAEGQEFVGELPIGAAEDESGVFVGSVSGQTRRRSSTTTSVRTIDGHPKSKASSLASPKPKRRSGSVRWQPSDDVDSDDEIKGLKDGITVELQDRIDQIERLAQEGKQMKLGRGVFADDSVGGGVVSYGRGVELDGGHSSSVPQILHDGQVADDGDNVIPLLMDGLQNLQPQTTMETATTRYLDRPFLPPWKLIKPNYRLTV